MQLQRQGLELSVQSFFENGNTRVSHQPLQTYNKEAIPRQYLQLPGEMKKKWKKCKPARKVSGKKREQPKTYMNMNLSIKKQKST